MVKNLPIALSLALISFFSINSSKAQKISFATDVKPNGEMVGQNTRFYIPKGGGDIKMLVNIQHKINSDTAIYKVYRLSAKGDKYLDQTIKDPIKPDWYWFYTDLYIRSQGKYLVEVYGRGSDKLEASGEVQMLFK